MKPVGKSRKRVAQAPFKESSNDSSSGSDVDAHLSDESSDDLQKQEINVEFEAFPPAERDFHGIKNLLLKVFLLLHLDVSELTDLVISQSNVGSTIKIADDEDDVTFGVISIISLNKFQDKTCIKELKKQLLSKLKESLDEDKKKFENYLNDRSIGFLINERFINIPPQIAAPFHKSLRDEVEEAKKQDVTYKFDYLLLISKTLKPTVSQVNDNEAGSSKKKKKKHRPSEEEIEYTNFEEEIFHKASEVSFSYEVTKATGLAVGGDWDSNDQPMKTYRTVMLVSTKKWKDIVNEIQDMLK